MDHEFTTLNDGSQPPTKTQSLQTLTSSGPLSSSLSTLSTSSNRIPTNKDFHFYYNFGEFKAPIQQIGSQSNTLLDSIGYTSTQLCKKNLRFPTRDDPDEAYDWLVNVNDEIFERFGSSIDEFERSRKKEEGGEGVDDDGFQIVNGKKKKKVFGSLRTSTSEFGNDLVVKVADRKGIVGGKAKIPFHIAAIRKPQEEYAILVNNSNKRFEHVWLVTSEDGSRVVHPLEKLNVLDFVNSCRDAEPVLPQPLESTPFKFVEEVKDLKELAAKLRAVNEFAVDLEHNQYRSFQGLTCLMQISTRTEDFVVDTLKLRVQMGPYLREVFKDPSKKKVFHGADRDILWLQRDFGIYVCNMFDTGQASRVLKLERFSLEFLLQHFCGITANKEYQNADWRLRPLPPEMIKYAREDTHYLLHVYDTMTVLLETMPKDPEQSDPPLVEVYKRSYDVCMQLYERELLTETSYLHLYGLQGAGFNAQQLAIVAGLYEWRDVVARAEDESTGYILPNKTLLEIAKQMPVTPQMLRRVMKSKLPYVERNLGTIVSIIRHCMQNAGAFEAAAQQLKEARMETAPPENVENEGDENGATDIGITEEISGGYSNDHKSGNVQFEKKHLGHGSNLSNFNVGQGSQFVENGAVKIGSFGLEVPNRSMSVTLQSGDANAHPTMSSVSKASVASVQVQVQKKPTRGFGALLGKKPTGGIGALLGSKVPKGNPDIDAKEKELAKLEKIRSSVSLLFYSIPTESVPKSDPQEPNKVMEASDSKAAESGSPGISSKLEDIMMLEDHSEEYLENDADSESKPMRADEKSVVSASEMNHKDGAVSLSDLSTSFEKCFQSISQTNKEAQKAKEQNKQLKLKPFDYATARQQVKLGENAAETSDAACDRKQRPAQERLYSRAE